MVKKRVPDEESADKGGASNSLQSFVNGADELVSAAKSEGRFVVLPCDQFYPDPDQPRKTFTEEGLSSLQLRIEENGQVQAIVVGEADDDGRYPIISGERRWRAISQSNTVSTVDAVIKKAGADELLILLMQIDENNSRESVPVLENAEAISRVVDLCGGQGGAALRLGLSPGRVSKCLSILSAPPEVKALAESGEVQDVDALYYLRKAFLDKPEEAVALVDEWRRSEGGVGLRSASEKLAKSKSKPKKKKKVEGAGKGITSEVGGFISADSASIVVEGDSYFIDIASAQGVTRFRVSQSVVDGLVASYTPPGALH